AELLTRTAGAALLLAAGKPLSAGLVSAEAVALACSVTHALLVTKLKIACVALLAATAFAAGAYSLARKIVPERIGGLALALSQQPVLPVSAAVETTLKTSGGQIRQFAFDGDENTYFESTGNAGWNDHFTLVFDAPVAVQSLVVIAGRPDEDDRMDA